MHRQFTPYYPQLCRAYLERFVDIVKHRRRIEQWDIEASAQEVMFWKETERALNDLLQDFITDLDDVDGDRVERLRVVDPSAAAASASASIRTPTIPASDKTREDDLESLPDPRVRGVDDSLPPPPVAKSMPASDALPPPLPPFDMMSPPPATMQTFTGTAIGVQHLPPESVKSPVEAIRSPVSTVKAPADMNHTDSRGGGHETSKPSSAFMFSAERQQVRAALLKSADREPSTDPGRPTVYQALTGPHADVWLDLIEAEMARLGSLKSWEVVDWAAPGLEAVRERQSPLTGHFSLKISPDDSGVLRQVHLSVKEQSPSHQPTLMSLRTMLAAMCQRRYRGHECQLVQFDYVNPWLNQPVSEDEVIYVLQPPGLAVHPHGMVEPVYKLRRALYAVDSVRDSWAHSARTCLEGAGLTTIEGSPGMFFHKQLAVGVAVYVDEIVCLGKSEDIEEVRELLHSVLCLRNPGPLQRIGTVEIRPKLWYVELSQAAEIQRLLFRLGVDGKGASHVTLPMTPVSNSKLAAQVMGSGTGNGKGFGIGFDTGGVGVSEASTEPYLSINKQQWYLYTYNKLKSFAHATRPDIAYALLRLSPRTRETIKSEDYAALWRLLFYLKRTLNSALAIGPGSGMATPGAGGVGDVDQLRVHASVAPTPIVTVGTPRYIGGGALMLGHSLVHWYWSFIKEDPADLHEATFINTAQSVYQASNLRQLLHVLCPDAPRAIHASATAAVAERAPHMVVSDSVAVEELLSQFERDTFSTDATIGRCYRYVRSRTHPRSLDHLFTLMPATLDEQSIARGLVTNLDRDLFLAWHAKIGLRSPAET